MGHMVETLATGSKRMEGSQGGGGRERHWLSHPRYLHDGLPDNRVRAPQCRPLQSPRGQPRLPPATTKDRNLAHCPSLSTLVCAGHEAPSLSKSMPGEGEVGRGGEGGLPTLDTGTCEDAAAPTAPGSSPPPSRICHGLPDC